MATYTIADNMSVVLCSGDDIGGTMLVACDLSDPAGSVLVNYMEGHDWEVSRCQSAETRGTLAGLRRVARILAAEVAEMDPADPSLDVEVRPMQGDLCDESDNTIRRASLQECFDSHAAGAEGWFNVDGQRCYVDLD